MKETNHLVSMRFNALLVQEIWDIIDRQKALNEKMKKDYQDYQKKEVIWEKEQKERDKYWEKKIYEYNIEEYGYWIIEDPYGNYLKFALTNREKKTPLYFEVVK